MDKSIKRNSVIIVAAGLGQRAGGIKPKQWQKVLGKRIVDWTLAPTASNNPDATNRFVFREYEYLIGGTTGTLPEFDNFQLKIVFHSTDRSKVVRIKDLRTIALSV